MLYWSYLVTPSISSAFFSCANQAQKMVFDVANARLHEPISLGNYYILQR